MMCVILDKYELYSFEFYVHVFCCFLMVAWLMYFVAVNVRFILRMQDFNKYITNLDRWISIGSALFIINFLYFKIMLPTLIVDSPEAHEELVQKKNWFRVTQIVGVLVLNI